MRVFPIDLPAGCPVLVTGAGGGFDFVCGLPIALELEDRGHPVHLGSYSFSDLSAVQDGHWPNEHLLEVTADSALDSDYFPERDVAAWYRERRGRDMSVFCFKKQAVGPTRDSYRWLVDQLGIGAVVCVDGGIDGIFRGDEADLGTPSMDSVSVIATHLSGAPHRIYATTAFGIEGAEGKVSHAQALQRMAELLKMDAGLGVGQVLKQTEVGRSFLDAVEFVFARMSPLRRSIIVSALRAAMQGAFGRTSVHPKTEERPPWISPLTSLFWYFEADAVSRIKLFYQDALDAPSLWEISKSIDRLRDEGDVKPFEPIPI